MRSHEALRSASPAVLVLALLACASTPTQLYEGDPRPLSEVATLETEYPRQIDIFAVNRKKVYGSAWHLAPGRHEVWTRIIQIESAGQSRFTMHAYCVFDVRAKPGGTYRILPDTTVAAGANQKAVSVGALLYDSISRKKAEPTYCGSPPDFSE